MSQIELPPQSLNITGGEASVGPVQVFTYVNFEKSTDLYKECGGCQICDHVQEEVGLQRVWKPILRPTGFKNS